MKTLALLAVVLLAFSPVGAAVAGPAGSAAEPPAPPVVVPRGVWDWPLIPRPAVLRAFDPPPRPWLNGHRGVDLRAAHDGALILAPAAGTVSFVGIVVDRPVITIDHGNGLKSSFEPAGSRLLRGATVVKGDLLGWVEAGHCGRDPCIHWGVRRGAEYLNPLAFVLDLRPSVLLPLDPGRK